MRQIDHHLATGVAAGEAARTHKVWNPSTGEVQAEVAMPRCSNGLSPRRRKSSPNGPRPTRSAGRA